MLREQSGLVIAMIAVLITAAAAQESRSSIALEGTGAFTADSSGHDAFDSRVARHVDTAGGFLVSYRYRLWSWLSAEVNYGFAPNSIRFSTASGAFTGDAYMHQVTTDFVMRLPASARFKFSPYLLMGGGALIFSPTSDGFRTTGGFQSSPAATRETDAAFVYGSITVRTLVCPLSPPEPRCTRPNRLSASRIAFSSPRRRVPKVSRFFRDVGLRTHILSQKTWGISALSSATLSNPMYPVVNGSSHPGQAPQ